LNSIRLALIRSVISSKKKPKIEAEIETQQNNQIKMLSLVYYVKQNMIFHYEQNAFKIVRVETENMINTASFHQQLIRDRSGFARELHSSTRSHEGAVLRGVTIISRRVRFRRSSSKNVQTYRAAIHGCGDDWGSFGLESRNADR